MKIKYKIQLINLLQGLCIMALLAVFFTMNATIEKIGEEQKILTSLYNSLLNEQLISERFLTRDIKETSEEFSEARTYTESLFDQVEALEYLPRLTDTIKEAIESIYSLKIVRTVAYNEIDKNLSIINSGLTGLDLKSEMSLFRIFDEAGKLPDSEKTRNMKFQVFNVVRLISRNGKSVDDFTRQVDEEIAHIDREIKRQNSQNQTLLFAAGIIVVLIFLLISTFQSGNLARRIRIIDKLVGIMKDGTLTRRFPESGRDELETLGQNLNIFQQSLISSLSELQESARQNQTVQKNLMDQVEQTESQTVNMGDQSANIGELMDGLRESITVSTGSMDNLNQSSETLNNQIIEQISMVEESTASVTEIIASIENVQGITDKKTKVIQELEETVKQGEQKLEENAAAIGNITGSIDSISGIAEMINNIAEQTNLLAMNAAIEAAHAGEAGKGFAVVSDEIRKLAEAAAQNSKMISSSLQEIIIQITEAGTSSSESTKMFDRISSEIVSFSGSLQEIAQSMDELKVGGKQILLAMETLREVSHTIKENSGSMAGNSTDLESTMQTLTSASLKVSDHITDIQTSIININSVVGGVKSLSDSVGESATASRKSIARFKLEEDVTV